MFSQVSYIYNKLFHFFLHHQCSLETYDIHLFPYLRRIYTFNFYSLFPFYGQSFDHLSVIFPH